MQVQYHLSQQENSAMKPGTRLLAPAEMLLTLCALFPVSLQAQASPQPPAVFDHDPMSIVVGPIVGPTASGGEQDRTLSNPQPFFNNNKSLRVADYLDNLEINRHAPVTVFTATDDTGTDSISLECFADLDRSRRRGAHRFQLTKLILGTDYQLDPATQPIKGGMAVFKIEFLPHSLVVIRAGVVLTLTHRKILLVATKASDTSDIREDCIQTLTVYDPNAQHTLGRRRHPTRRQTRG